MEIDRSRSLPIAEDFHSLQGEGQWVGTPMHFIRLAGCSVGEEQLPPFSPNFTLPILKTGAPAWLCHTYDGRPFWCDTDFHLHHWSTFNELLDTTWEKHVCITGGEPLLHKGKLDTLLDLTEEFDIQFHIETSGTIDWQNTGPWISVSPKQNALDSMIDFADEIKLLVDADFDLEKIPFSINQHGNVYIQPINDELMVSKPNFDLCMKILQLRPHWKMSVQTHKLLGLR